MSKIICPLKINAKAGIFNISVVKDDIEDEVDANGVEVHVVCVVPMDVEVLVVCDMEDEVEVFVVHGIGDDVVHTVEVDVHAVYVKEELEHISSFSSYACTSCSSSSEAHESSELHGSSSGVFGISHVRCVVSLFSSSLMIFLILRHMVFEFISYGKK